MRENLTQSKPPKALSVVVGVLLFAIGLFAYRPTRAWFLSFAGLAGYLGFCAAMLWHASVHEVWRRIGKRAKLAAGLMALASLAFFTWYFTLYDFIPVWDYQHYWTSTLYFNAHMDAHPLGAVLDAIRSVNFMDYNELQCWIMSLPARLFPTWSATLLSEFTLFYIPTAVLFSLFGLSVATTPTTQKVTNNTNGASAMDWLFVGLFALGLLCPIMLRPILDGYLDAVGLVAFLACLCLAFDSQLVRSPLKAMLLGVGLCVPMLLRRWFVYGIVGLIVAASVWWLLRILLQPAAKRLQALIGVAKTFCIALVSAAVPLATAFRGFVVRSVLGNYGEAYQSWNSGASLVARLQSLAEEIGYGWLLLAMSLWILALVSARRTPSKQERAECTSCALASFCLAMGALTAALIFWRVQDFSPQHYYTFFPLLVLALMCGIAEVFLWVSPATLHVPASVATALLAAITCVNGINLAGSVGTVISPITGKVATAPMVQPGVQERKELVKYLDSATDEDDVVYFACASVYMNHSVVIGSIAPEHVESPFICIHADVDSRDGFNMAFFDAQYVVATTPVQLHMDPQNEQVVTILNELVQDPQSCVGKHYVLDRDIDIHDGVVAHVYKRVSDFEEADVEELEKLFVGLYPQWPELFQERFQLYRQEHAA